MGGAALRAAVDLVSPANKDRPINRETFSLKCASYLEKGVSIVVVAVVTGRITNMHSELLNVLRLPTANVWKSPTHLAAMAYRVVRSAGRRHLEMWQHALAVGEPLPTLPLWLAADLCVPLHLESSYVAACAALRLSA